MHRTSFETQATLTLPQLACIDNSSATEYVPYGAISSFALLVGHPLAAGVPD